MSTKQPITITITVESIENKRVLAIILADFLEHTGLEVNLTMTNIPTDEELADVFLKFDDNIQNCINTSPITIAE